MAPGGIWASVTGGGDCLSDADPLKLFLSPFSLSAVPGGVGEGCPLALAETAGPNGAVCREAVDLLCCRTKYDADLGSSGRGEVGIWYEERRLREGEEEAEAAGLRWAGGV